MNALLLLIMLGTTVAVVLAVWSRVFPAPAEPVVLHVCEVSV